MARVKTATKSNRTGTKQYHCTSCRQPIEPGQTYYYWARRNRGEQQQHQACGYPRPSLLSGRKTAVVEDAIQDATKALADWSPRIPEDLSFDSDALREGLGDTYEVDTDEIDSILQDVRDQAEEVGQEYEGNADAMPENLQYGSQAEAMREVASELEDWASNVEDWASQANTTVEVPDPADFDNEDDWASALQEAHDAVVDEMRTAAEAALEDLPEYQG